MIPIIVVVKLVKELGLIPYLAAPLEPVMKFVGLPAEMGLVWATALVSNIYGALIVFSTIVADHPLTAAQATVLGVMMLVGHNLPVEIKIAQATGSRVWFQVFLRTAGAVALGLVVSVTYRYLDIHQGPAAMLWQPPEALPPGLGWWALGELRNLAMIFCTVTALMAFLRFLEAIRATHLIYKIIAPILRLIGIGPKASSLAVIGLTLGIAYGGGMLINEARTGRMSGRDTFHTLSFLGICHSVFEDSLLLALIGAKFSGLLWGRIIFAIIVIAILARITARLSESSMQRWLWTKPERGEPEPLTAER
jgi:spore maturation protein SpmB